MSTPQQVCDQLVATLAKMAEPKGDPSVEDRLKTFTTYATAVAALGAAFYVFGFLIINARLAQFGIRSFSLADPAYAPAGAGFFAVVVAPIILLLVFAFHFRMGRASASAMMLVLYSAYFSAMIWMFFDPTPEGAAAAASASLLIPGGVTAGAWASSLVLSWIAVFWVLPRSDEKKEAKEARDEQTLKFALVIPAVMALVAVISMWGRWIYPVGSPVVGGGRMPTVQIELKSDVSPLISELLHVPAGTRVLPPMPILQDADGMLTVVLPGQRALAMDRSMILSVQYAR